MTIYGEQSPRTLHMKLIRIGVTYSCPQYTAGQIKAQDWTGDNTELSLLWPETPALSSHAVSVTSPNESRIQQLTPNKVISSCLNYNNGFVGLLRGLQRQC